MQQKSTPGTLGTFAGVFTPSILTILGIILFLRLGYVVGQAGLGRALIILAMANGISILTTISLSAIATNLKVKGGGDYYLISRTLGPAFGGSIGIVLYLAQSVSIAFYCIGFGEVVSEITGSNLEHLPQVVAITAVCFLFVFAWLGADWATRFQFVVMSILGLALVSFFVGGFAHWDTGLLARNWNAPNSPVGFWIIFAIFFPAVTGFTQGVSMSGDLRDSGKSLPLGTFLAVGLSIVIYIMAAVVLAASVPQNTLMNDYSAMKQVAFVDFLITAGVVAATLSSAMASFLGAPRILQSLASDRIFPFLLPFAKVSGPAGNPRRGVLLSWVIALATVGIGNLNLIAPVVSMFFLISYGLLNYATYYEARSASPSFRPKFRWFNAYLSLLGAIGCLAIMLAINLAAGIVALAVLLAIHQYLQRTAGPSRWADSRRAYHLQSVRQHLLAAAAEQAHPRYWRPQILLFSDDADRRERLLQFAAWIQGQSGFTAVVRIFDAIGPDISRQKNDAETELQKEIGRSGLDAFPLIVCAPDFHQSFQTLLQAFGVGPIRANTILLNLNQKQPGGAGRYFELLFNRNLVTAHRFGCNIVMLDPGADKWQVLERLPGKDRRIDVWWSDDATGRLMILLAYMISKDRDWENSSIRLIGSAAEDGQERETEKLNSFLEEVRINASVHILVDITSDSIVEESADAALVFLPFRIRENQPVDPLGGALHETLFALPATAAVLAAENIDLDAEPEEGRAADIASALDNLADAQKDVDLAQEAFEKAERALASVKDRLSKMTGEQQNGLQDETVRKLEAEAAQAETHLRKTRQKLEKGKTRAVYAARRAEALGAELPLSDKEDEAATDT